MAQQNPNSGNNPTTDEFLEFCSSDDAWYSVSVVLSDETLTVKYCNLSDVFDERYNANDFKTEKEIDDFRVRFRPASMQLQDLECRKAIEGVLVCASHEFREEDVRFYNAFIEERYTILEQVSEHPCNATNGVVTLKQLPKLLIILRNELNSGEFVGGGFVRSSFD